MMPKVKNCVWSKKAGYEMTLTGIAPFSVVLGKHDAVNITLNGETVDSSAFPKIV